MKDILNFIDNFISGFMRPIKDFIIQGIDWLIDFMANKEGAFVVLLFGLVFVGIIFLVGLIRIMRKSFKLFLFMLLLLAIVTGLTVVFG